MARAVHAAILLGGGWAPGFVTLAVLITLVGLTGPHDTGPHDTGAAAFGAAAAAAVAGAILAALANRIASPLPAPAAVSAEGPSRESGHGGP
ncbi:hypothetical protein AB0J35_16670 [Nonomuraea angiospora]|uniref:hypothetical protein n=1 Tax=Nonomuraea angiospora TaxID=46172 RepID=UPI003428AF0E